MKKTFLLAVMLLITMLSFAGCGEETDKDGRLIGDDQNQSITEDVEDGANDVIDDTERVGDDIIDDVEDVLDGDTDNRNSESEDEKKSKDTTKD